ncbi:ferritin-like domain-containing protein [Desulfitobacterium sp.]|uniref:ferritin-like domain-containing protein n=1 Tax=Desulfitobacterium sp. TaxID=49981 RepID=UPI002C959671|nr:ferritin-like domain-containing protein [Desulfitobacterium sp.]HVJ47675.1 ferritin-like domain-containing protein [Desulfitobacterium sp.]
MDKEELINSLNWFYSLETSQVELYTAQSRKFKDQYGGMVFERVAEIEQGHGDLISAKIKELGGTPTQLGEVISTIIGASMGTILSMTGLDMALRINIKLEEKAMSDYSQLIASVEKEGESPESELCKLLKYNYVDEDLHAAEFAKLIGTEGE